MGSNIYIDTAYATRLCFPIDLGVLKGFPDWAPRREIRIGTSAIG